MSFASSDPDFRAANYADPIDAGNPLRIYLN